MGKTVAEPGREEEVPWNRLPLRSLHTKLGHKTFYLRPQNLVRFVGCPHMLCVSYGTVHSLCVYLSNATALHLHTAFSDAFARCKRLTVVNVRSCILFDDSAVFSLTQSNKFLVSLCLSGCHMISDKALQIVGMKCQYLQVLDLTKTKVHCSWLHQFLSATEGFSQMLFSVAYNHTQTRGVTPFTTRITVIMVASNNAYM